MKVLMIRFSAMGDVALLNPVIRSALLHNDELEIHVVTKKNNSPFFNNLDKVIGESTEEDESEISEKELTKQDIVKKTVDLCILYSETGYYISPREIKETIIKKLGL